MRAIRNGRSLAVVGTSVLPKAWQAVLWLCIEDICCNCAVNQCLERQPVSKPIRPNMSWADAAVLRAIVVPERKEWELWEDST